MFGAADADRAAERILDLGLRADSIARATGLPLRGSAPRPTCQLLLHVPPQLERRVAGGDSRVQIVIGVVQLPIRPLDVQQVIPHRRFQIGQRDVGVGPRDQHAVENAGGMRADRQSGCIRCPLPCSSGWVIEPMNVVFHRLSNMLAGASLLV